MIENKKQYEITKIQLEKFKKAIDKIDLKGASDESRLDALTKIELDALKSERDVLSEQIKEYESNL